MNVSAAPQSDPPPMHTFRSAIRRPILAGLWSLLLATALHAVTLTEQPKAAAAEREATITWKTDVVSGSRVSYGTRPDLLTQRAEGGVTSTHTVTINGLEPGTTYYFTVGSARQRLGEGSFTTTGSGKPASRPLPKLQESPESKSAKASPAPKPAAPPLKAPPTRDTWGNLSTLQDHFERHGPDFQSKSPDHYAAQAWHFLQRARAEGLPMKFEAETGTLRVWDGKTRSFAAYNRDGTAKTYFRPSDPTYFNRQPGKPVKPSQLKLK